MSPTLILCHGAWHTPEAWDPVKAAFEAKGYRCLAPKMLYNYGETPIQSMTPVVTALQEVIAAETSSGHDVVLVNHSLAGMAGTSAVKGFTRRNASKLTSQNVGRVVGLVQLTAWLPTEDNDSLAKIISDFDRRHPDLPYIGVRAETDERGWWVLQGNPADYFYSDMPEEEAKKRVAKLIKFSAQILVAEDSVYAGWRDVPMWYLVCTKDMAIRTELQEDMIRKCREGGADITTRACDAGHSPFATKFDETIAFIEDAVKSFSTRGKP